MNCQLLFFSLKQLLGQLGPKSPEKNEIEVLVEGGNSLSEAENYILKKTDFTNVSNNGGGENHLTFQGITMT